MNCKEPFLPLNGKVPPKTKKVIFGLMALALSLVSVSSLAQPSKLDLDWNKYTSGHFLIYYHPSVPQDYIREFAGKCERYYRLFCARMGFQRANFWGPRQPTAILLFANKSAYLKFSEQPKWLASSIDTYYFEQDFFETTLPHRLTPLILEEFTGLKKPGPLWFRQGLALANEKDSRAKYLLPAQELLKKGRYLSLAEMEKLSEQKAQRSPAFSAVSASCLIYLLEHYGRDDFARLCQSLRQGLSFYEAMAEVYGIKDAQELNEKLLVFLQSAPRPIGR